jgi:hypothetical protein
MTIALKTIRLVHRYSGLFFAPAILFFAITGGLQMFGLHESSRGSAYVPPAILVHLSQLHKKGTLYLPPRRPAPPPANLHDVQKPPAAPPASPPSHSLPVRIFFAATALALMVSTLTGIVMAWKFERRKSIVILILAAGVLIPGILLLF